MSAAHVSAQEISNLYTQVYCYYAACAILVYDWFLCLSQEVRFIWNWHSKVNSSSLVYSFSRYAVLIEALLIVATNYPMSDLVRNVTTILPSNRLIVVYAELSGKYMGPGSPQDTGHDCVQRILCPACLRTVEQEQMVVGDNHPFGATTNGNDYCESPGRRSWLWSVNLFPGKLQCFYEAPENLPSPLNCSAPSSLSTTLTLSVGVVWRGSQLVAELLVVAITWWYGYQSYRMRKGIKLGKTISSLLIYNGSLYFLFLATLYILDIIFNTISLPDTISNAANFLSDFYDPITSILVCHFILELRQFDSSPASVTYPEMGSRVRGHMASRDILQFAAQPSDSLPTSIASFAGLVHVDSALSETDLDAIDDDAAEWREMDVVPGTDSDDAILPLAKSGS